jgi:glucose/mannose transport system substrate-binding protein
MRYKSMVAALAATVSMAFIGSVRAADVEVTHWWTSGGEAAAVAEFAKAFDANGKWVDSAIAVPETLPSIIISRILGGNPVGATQLNRQDADDLVKSRSLLNLTELQKLKNGIKFTSQSLASCTIGGKVGACQ